MEENNEIHWNEQLERIVSNEGERALCYNWLHKQSEKKFNALSIYIALPTIILSTITGSASIGSTSIFPDQLVASMTIGMISLSVAIFNSVSNYFAWTKRAETHRISALTYGRLHRFVMIELSLPRKERMNAKDTLKMVREQLDRLQETSPPIPDDIIRLFNKRFEKGTDDVSKPLETNGLDPINVYHPLNDTHTP